MAFNILQTNSMTHVLQVTLEEMYNGTQKGLIIKRRVVCDACYGMFPAADGCHKCNGRKTITSRNDLLVQVRRGTTHGHKITYEGDGNHQPNKLPGDVVVQFEQIDHRTFERRQDNLWMEMKLSLTESILGFDRLVTTLDNRRIRIRSRPGEVIQHMDLKCVHGKGMPLFRNPERNGNLIIRFLVDIPRRFPLRGAFKYEAYRQRTNMFKLSEHEERDIRTKFGIEGEDIANNAEPHNAEPHNAEPHNAEPYYEEQDDQEGHMPEEEYYYGDDDDEEEIEQEPQPQHIFQQHNFQELDEDDIEQVYIEDEEDVQQEYIDDDDMEDHVHHEEEQQGEHEEEQVDEELDDSISSAEEVGFLSLEEIPHDGTCTFGNKDGFIVHEADL